MEQKDVYLSFTNDTSQYLFICPFAISQHPSTWSFNLCHPVTFVNVTQNCFPENNHNDTLFMYPPPPPPPPSLNFI